ncbi:MAG: T9SS C-terminal target domain-containing protein [Gemmatimonadetes bacterium]|nr:MAG: T9SS C-terminal target domain-containing protein [Gemmatimonadota bacterium]
MDEVWLHLDFRKEGHMNHTPPVFIDSCEDEYYFGPESEHHDTWLAGRIDYTSGQQTAIFEYRLNFRPEGLPGGATDYDSGVSLEYPALTPLSSVVRCTEFYGNFDAVYLRDHTVSVLEYNHIHDNRRNGVAGSRSGGIIQTLRTNTFANNMGTEILAWEHVFRQMTNGNNQITDVEDSPGYDHYLLLMVGWDGITPVDVRGNNFTYDDNPERFYPSYEAFIFDEGGGSGDEELLLQAGVAQMNEQQYESAAGTFQQLIETYPATSEARTGLNYLYFIENYTEQDFAALRDYMTSLDVGDNSLMLALIEEIETKTYRDERDYLTAIERLEAIIANPPDEETLLYALIDEAYCYLRLEEGGGLRSAKPQCSVQPQSYEEYQDITRELRKELAQLQRFVEQGNTQTQTPESYSLTVYPNPFNPRTTIHFDLSQSGEVSLKIYDLTGRLVRVLVSETREAGSYSASWYGTDEQNQEMPSGIYILHLETDHHSQSKPLILLK